MNIQKNISRLILPVFLLTVCSLLYGKDKKADSDRTSVSISAVGDIMLHDSQLEAARDPVNGTYDFSGVFKPVKTLLSAADLTVGNLETTFPGDTALIGGYPRFGAPDTLAHNLKIAGFDILATANNHCCDTGPSGFAHTLDVLDKNGIFHLGTYRSKKEFLNNRFLMIEKNGLRLAFLNYSYGVNSMPVPKGACVNRIRESQIIEDIRLARSQKPDAIIAIMHWGKEYQRKSGMDQKQLFYLLIKEGVDVILGSHPHVIQPYAMYMAPDRYGTDKPRLIIFSLGNFLSNQRERYRNGGIIFNFTLEKSGKQNHGQIKISNVHYIPVWVYRKETSGRPEFYLLPVRQYINNDQAIRLSKTDFERMKQFYEDTKSHLRNSELQVDHFFSSFTK